MIQKQWVLRDIDQGQSRALAQALSISPITATVLLGRGLARPEDARDWMSPSEEGGHNPFLLPDMDRAVDRIHQAIHGGEKVCFYGDYDVDGISAISLHLKFFEQVGCRACMYIPARLTEGYGLNEQAIHHLAAEGVTVLVTADCGTTSHREVSLAAQLGMDVIVTDHHQIQGEFPDVWAFLNPYRPDSAYPFRGLCSGGLAYKVAEAYTMKYGLPGMALGSLRDLVALATIADVVPLQDENRAWVRDGLIRMTQGTRCGIRALKHRLSVTSLCTASTVGFRLAPVINASGRLAHAKLGVQLLTTESEEEANHLAEHLDRLNRHRRELEQEILEQARDLVEKAGEAPAVVVGARGWHLGVVGIVASRLVERYHRPAVVIAFDEKGLGRGSVRSVPGFDVCEVLERCRDRLEGFGGHPSAAGLTLREEHFPEFRKTFLDVTAASLASDNGGPILDLDAQVNLSEIHPQLVRELDQLHPFGMGNPEPTFLVKGLTVLEKRIVGDDHLKLVVRDHRSIPFDSIGFRLGSLASKLSSPSLPIDLAFIPELNHWKGYHRVQLRIRDLRVS